MNYCFRDSYEHLDLNIEYLPESLISSELNSSTYEFAGCSCISSCRDDTCACLQRSGAKYSFENQAYPESYLIIKDTVEKPIYECNENCNCRGILCGNRLVQCGPRKGLEVVSFGSKGLGLITKKTIPASSFICEYAGKIITPDKAEALYHNYKSKYSMNYIFCIIEKFGEKIYKTIIDPTESGNIGRYINHSCEPNSELMIVRVNNNIPKLCIFAKENISCYEKITFNYGDSTHIKNITGTQSANIKCLCGSVSCNKFLPFDESCFET